MATEGALVAEPTFQADLCQAQRGADDQRSLARWMRCWRIHSGRQPSVHLNARENGCATRRRLGRDRRLPGFRQGWARISCLAIFACVGGRGHRWRIAWSRVLKSLPDEFPASRWSVPCMDAVQTASFLGPNHLADELIVVNFARCRRGKRQHRHAIQSAPCYLVACQPFGYRHEPQRPAPRRHEPAGD